MPTNYIDQIEFYKLFKRRNVNHEKICLEIAKIVKGVGDRFYIFNMHDGDDIYSSALVDALSKIKYFNTRKSKNAFSYFTTVAWNAYLQALRERKRWKSKIDVYAAYKINLNKELLETR